MNDGRRPADEITARQGYLRHLGHADLMRETIDGLVGEDPPRP